MQEASAHEAKRLSLYFYVEAKTFVRALHSMHIENSDQEPFCSCSVTHVIKRVESHALCARTIFMWLLL